MTRDKNTLTIETVWRTKLVDGKLLFVYGSLRKGCGNHVLLEDEKVSYLGNHVTDPVWTMYSLGGFPALKEDGTTAITGEVYSVSEAVYEAIEHLEGYPTFYQRKSLRTPYGEAEVYYIADLGKYGQENVVEDGDWCNYLADRNYSVGW